MSWRRRRARQRSCNHRRRRTARCFLYGLRMRFAEVDLFGVYVAPISLLMVAAWVVTMGLRRLAIRGRLLRWVWHPALFVFAVYVIVLASLTLATSHLPPVFS